MKTAVSIQEYFGRASVFPDGKGRFVMLIHAMQVGFTLLSHTCDVPEHVAQEVVGSSGDFLVRMHAMGTALTANDILDAFWYLARYKGFRGYVIPMRSHIVLITIASHLVEELRHSIECGNINGAHSDTFDMVWARMAIMLYTALFSQDGGCQWRYWSQDELVRQLEAFGMQIRFFDREAAPAQSQVMAFTFNSDLMNRLEGVAMQCVSECTAR
jgi:hypothetical protein